MVPQVQINVVSWPLTSEIEGSEDGNLIDWVDFHFDIQRRCKFK